MGICSLYGVKVSEKRSRAIDKPMLMDGLQSILLVLPKELIAIIVEYEWIECPIFDPLYGDSNVHGERFAMSENGRIIQPSNDASNSSTVFGAYSIMMVPEWTVEISTVPDRAIQDEGPWSVGFGWSRDNYVVFDADFCGYDVYPWRCKGIFVSRMQQGRRLPRRQSFRTRGDYQIRLYRENDQLMFRWNEIREEISVSINGLDVGVVCQLTKEEAGQCRPMIELQSSYRARFVVPIPN